MDHAKFCETLAKYYAGKYDNSIQFIRGCVTYRSEVYEAIAPLFLVTGFPSMKVKMREILRLKLA